MPFCFNVYFILLFLSFLPFSTFHSLSFFYGALFFPALLSPPNLHDQALSCMVPAVPRYPTLITPACRSLIPRISPQGKKVVAYKPFFVANFDFSTKHEVVFKIKKIAIGTNKQFYKEPICQISSLFDVWFDLPVALKINKGYFAAIFVFST